jgi:hypothetical protein
VAECIAVRQLLTNLLMPQMAWVRVSVSIAAEEVGQALEKIASLPHIKRLVGLFPIDHIHAGFLWWCLAELKRDLVPLHFGSAGDQGHGVEALLDFLRVHVVTGL